MFAESIEERRLAAPASKEKFGTGSEPAYDAITKFASNVFDVPISILSLVLEDEHGFKSGHGLDMCNVERARALCAHVLETLEPLIVLDARFDQHVPGAPAFDGEEELRFFAGVPLVNSSGHPLGALCIGDTRPRETFDAIAREKLEDLAALATALVEESRTSLPDRAISSFAKVMGLALITSNAAGKITYWNPAAEDIFGHSASEAIGKPIEIIIPERFRDHHVAGMKRVSTTGVSNLSGKTIELVAVRKNGSEFPVEMRLASWLGPDGIEIGAQIHDITDRRERELRLEHLAHHDALTGLANRNGFSKKLEAVIARGHATVFAIDLDRFKEVNDTFGHAVGDTLLQGVAVRLVGLLEPGATVARLGGDEFAILLPGNGAQSIATATAKRLNDAFKEPFVLSGHRMQIGLSIGIGLAPLHAEDAEELMLRADLALLEAKKIGQDNIRVFDPPIANQLIARRAFKDELRLATERGEWELTYQPQVRLSDQELIGVEALLRWKHPERGLLFPADFLNTLETHLVAHEVGEWVIDEACRQMAVWRMQGLDVQRMALNLFAAQFTNGNLGKIIGRALEKHALSPGDIEIEITETIALRSDDQILTALSELRDCGINIAFDDFGTGFASLSTLARLPVTRLKIDRSFVQDLCNRPQGAAIVTAVISLGRSLNLEVTAEGIETDEQRIRLLALGCREGQGYLFGKPVPASDDCWLDRKWLPARRASGG
ncbi:MAG: EAL domain-containing protein [Pseudomonadota bacterium]|nr:EAL domain-containing protein [Pseudomonadota bacterium]